MLKILESTGTIKGKVHSMQKNNLFEHPHLAYDEFVCNYRIHMIGDQLISTRNLDCCNSTI